MPRRSPAIDALDLQIVTEEADRGEFADTLAATGQRLARTSASPRSSDARLRSAQAALQGHAELSERQGGALADGRDALRHALDVARVATWSVDLVRGRCGWSPNARQTLCLPPQAPVDTLEGFFSQIVAEDAQRPRGMAEAAGRGEQLRGVGVSDPRRGRHHPLVLEPGAGSCRPSSRHRQRRHRRDHRAASARGDLREREQMLSGLAGASPDGIVVSELDGRIRFASDGILDVIGMRPEELVHCHTGEFVQRELHHTLVECTTTLLKDGSDAVEQPRLRRLHSGGHGVTVDCRVRLLTDARGDADGFVVVVRDVTERARLKAELARARDQAEAANRATSDHLSRISHELRTPMNSALGFAQVLESSELSSEDRDSLVRILGAGRHPLQLIDDVLDVARVEAGQFPISLAPVCIHDVVTDAADLLDPQLFHPAVQVSVEVCEQVWVTADRKRLTQVLINLLSNAVKSRRRDGEIILSGSVPEVGWYRPAVTDTGVGIADDLLPQLFRVLERLGADRADVPGTGLGLALSCTLTEAVGGRIGSDSVLGNGSTFWLDLTTAPPAEPPFASNTVAAPSRGTAPKNTTRTH